MSAGKAPAIGSARTPPLKDANSDRRAEGDGHHHHLPGRRLHQREVHPQAALGRLEGYWIDAASALRMKDDAVIILDPVNDHVIDALAGA
jgi:aspartate-semialdehyde dehydrogenase